MWNFLGELAYERKRIVYEIVYFLGNLAEEIVKIVDKMFVKCLYFR